MGFFDGQPPRAVAHRGWHLGDLAGCENTLAAFRRAVDEGYRYVETDVRLTSDGVLVVFHDEDLDRVTDTSGPIASLPWRAVRQARVAGREPIPTLEEMLAACPDAEVNIDAKTDATVGPLLDVVHEAGALDRVCVATESDRRLASIRQAAGPRLATSLGRREIARLVLSPARATARVGGSAAQVPPRYRGLPLVTPRLVAAARRAGVEVHVWTIDDPPTMTALLDLGVDGIMTDRPDLLRDVLERRGVWR